MSNVEKPYKGKIRNWSKQYHEECPGLGYIIVGIFDGHESFDGCRGHTSYVVYHDEIAGEIETKNSRYTLV